MAVQRAGSTWHGLAVNVTTDLAAYRSFSPCGLRGDVMTRVADHLPEDGGAPRQGGSWSRVKEALLVGLRQRWPLTGSTARDRRLALTVGKIFRTNRSRSLSATWSQQGSRRAGPMTPSP